MAITALVEWAGIGQIILCIGTLAIPGALRWKTELRPLQPTMRQLFLTYAGYIWSTNLAFGLISLLSAADLLAGTRLAIAITGFIGVYWLARVIIQFTIFDRHALADTRAKLAAMLVLEVFFILLVCVYAMALAINLGWLP